MLRYRVRYDVKNIDRHSSNFGLLQEAAREFESFPDAVKFMRDIHAGRVSGQVFGRPILERI